jgi:hypothetical protein
MIKRNLYANLKEVLRQVVTPIVICMVLCNSAFAQSKCPRTSDRFEVFKLDANNLNTGSLSVFGVPTMIVIDIDDLTLIPVPPPVDPFEINLDIGGGVVTTWTIQAYYDDGSPAYSTTFVRSPAHVAGEQKLPYKTYTVNINGNDCRSLILKSLSNNGPSFLISFDPTTGAPYVAQKLNAIAAIFSSNTIEFVIGNVNGDTRDDITVVDNGLTLAVLTAQGNGTFATDTLLSARAVWRAFSDAVKTNNPSLANAYLSKDSRTVLTPALQQSIAEMAITFTEVIDFEAVVVSPEIVEIKLVVKTNNELFAYSVTLVSDSGAWKIDAF